MRLYTALLGLIIYLLIPSSVFAATSPEITNFTNNTLQMITAIGSAAAVLFLIKGGYFYITSTGKPDSLDEAKKTMRNALIGLLLILGSSLIISTFQNSLTTPSNTASSAAIQLTPITTVTPSDGLAQVMIDAVTGIVQNIIESATKPVVDGIIGFLTTTPSLMGNSVIFNFWLVIVGITNALFVLVVALLGLHFMSASTLGFEELELKQLLPKIGLAFLGANTSLYLADFVITLSNTLVTAVLNLTGGLNHAWILNAINLSALSNNQTPLIILIFLLIFLIVSIILLLLYITRLIAISLAAVLAPFIFLLWVIPRFSDFAEIAIKSYMVTVFTVFVHVVIIQLAGSFLTLPGNSNNSLVSIAVGIGLFFMLLKTPSFLMQMIFFNSARAIIKKLGGQVMNVMSADKNKNAEQVSQTSTRSNNTVKTERRALSV